MTSFQVAALFGTPFGALAFVGVLYMMHRLTPRPTEALVRVSKPVSGARRNALSRG